MGAVHEEDSPYPQVRRDNINIRDYGPFTRTDRKEKLESGEQWQEFVSMWVKEPVLARLDRMRVTSTAAQRGDSRRISCSSSPGYSCRSCIACAGRRQGRCRYRSRCPNRDRHRQRSRLAPIAVGCTKIWNENKYLL